MAVRTISLLGPIVDTDATLAANSDGKIPSQKAVKTFVSARRLDQFVTPTTDIALGNVKLTGLHGPSASTDAANAQYVDDEIVYYLSLVSFASILETQVFK